MKQKVLLVVPHQDDELFVGGGLFKRLTTDGAYEGYVVFATNGDFYAHEAEVRLRESLYVLTKLYGLEESHIFFLGYGDGWQRGVHLYHQEGEEPLVSAAGRAETYGIEDHADYRWSRTGRHSAYRRRDFKQDLLDVLREVWADILLAVDCDKHPDHRAVSLLFEECLGEILREDETYRPLVLKRFAYDGVWKGKADFFETPRKGTVLTQAEFSPYREEEALRFAMPSDCTVPWLSDNFLYRAFRHYKTQEIWQKADEIINIDEAFFKRNTDNLLYGAHVTASSGNPAYLSDFKLFDCGDVLEKAFVLGECGWKPEESDEEKRVRIHFETPRTIGRIVIYARGDGGRDNLMIGISFDTGMTLAGVEIHPDGKKNLLTFAPQAGVRDIELHIEKWEGVSWGITELEVLPPEEKTLPAELEACLFAEDSLKMTEMVKMRIKIEKQVLSLKRKISRWLPNSYVLRRYYPELAERQAVPVGYRIKYMMRRIRQKLR